MEIRWPPLSDTHTVHDDSTLKCIIKNYIITRGQTSVLILETLNSSGQQIEVSFEYLPIVVSVLN